MVSIGHHRIGIMRVGGQLHALADRCPHRGAPLCSFGEIVTDIERLPDGTLAPLRRAGGRRGGRRLPRSAGPMTGLPEPYDDTVVTAPDGRRLAVARWG